MLINAQACGLTFDMRDASGRSPLMDVPSMVGLGSTLDLSTWTLLRGHGLYDSMAAALCRKLRLRQGDGRSDECQDFRDAQRFDAGEAHKAVLLPAALQEVLWVRQRGSAIEG